MILNIVLQISSAIGIAVIVFLFLACVMLFYARLAAKESVLILATYLAFYFKVPYLVPLIAGLYFSVSSIIPVTIGVFIWQFLPVAAELVKQGSGSEIEILELPTMFAEVYVNVLGGIEGKESWIFSAFIFAMMIIVVFAVSKTTLDYAKEISIGVGSVVCILSFIVVVIVADVELNILFLIISAIFSALIAVIIRFFDMALDYRRAESVQFEDEKDYYLVKAIPKIVLTKRKATTRRTARRREEEEAYERPQNERDQQYDDYYENDYEN